MDQERYPTHRMTKFCSLDISSKTYAVRHHLYIHIRSIRRRNGQEKVGKWNGSKEITSTNLEDIPISNVCSFHPSFGYGILVQWGRDLTFHERKQLRGNCSGMALVGFTNLYPAFRSIMVTLLATETRAF